MQRTLPYLSFQKVAHFLIVLVILTYAIVVGKDILVPLVFGVLLSFMLKPLYNRISDLTGSRMLGAFASIIVASVPILLVGMFFGVQLQKVIRELPDIIAGVEEGVREIISKGGELFGFPVRQTDQYLTQGLQDVSGALPLDFLSYSVSTTTSMLLMVSLTAIYCFFFLLYRRPFRKFLLQQFGPSLREDGSRMLNEVQAVAKQYFTGILTVMLILGVLNSLGLWLIGVDYPFLFGFLAALLAIIPYIGTFLGGLIPFLYSFASGDGYWQPIAIVGMYGVVQAVEGNIITPTIVGRSVNLNPIAAILALLLGEMIWGLPGMVVALPLLAIFRIVLDHIPNTQPLALALSDDFFNRSDLYETQFDHPQYRLVNIFLKQQKPLKSGQVSTAATSTVGPEESAVAERESALG